MTCTWLTIGFRLQMSFDYMWGSNIWPRCNVECLRAELKIKALPWSTGPQVTQGLLQRQQIMR